MYQDFEIARLKSILQEKETQTLENRQKIKTLRQAIKSGKYPLLDPQQHSVDFEIDCLQVARGLLRSEEEQHGKLPFSTREDKVAETESSSIEQSEK